MNMFDDDEDWQEMPVIRSTDSAHAKTQDLQDHDDIKRYHWRAPSTNTTLFDADEESNDKKDPKGKGKMNTNKQKGLASDYTRLELDEDAKEGEVHVSTDFLFDDSAEMTPLSQMQATKNLLSEGQRIAYVGLCKLLTREMVARYEALGGKANDPAVRSAQDWSNRIMGRLYLHMDVNASEQRMINQLGEHGVTPQDLVPSLITTHTVANPEYDPEARSEAASSRSGASTPTREDSEPWPASAAAESDAWSKGLEGEHRKRARRRSEADSHDSNSQDQDATTKSNHEENLIQPLPSALPGVSTTLTSRDATVTLDIRWTILCDLFLALIADSVYDSRSRVLLSNIAQRLDLSWEDVIRFEKRLTEALAIQEGVDEADQDNVMTGRDKAGRRRRIALMAAAGVGGGLVIGLSAGLLAPFIGAGIGATLGLVGISGTTTFLAGTGGAAIITTTGVLTGGRIATKGMGRRTASVRTFEFKPLHNNKRVSCWVTVPGFMAGKDDDVRLPFSVLDAIIGDVLSVLWEPETILQTGDALKILTGEILTQAGQQILAATVMTALMSAVQLPVMLTKLSYLIDNPWSNALDRARSAGAVLADILIQKHLGVRPISLIGFSLGARVIFYCLLELARTKNYGIVQEVYLLGATVTASKKQWTDVRSVVAGRFVNAYARNDWILGYLFRATTGGLSTVAGLRPVDNVPEIENVDITGLLTGHMSYRSSMPRILKHLGFSVTSEKFDEPDADDILRPDREVLSREEIQRRMEAKEKKANRWKWRRKKAATAEAKEDVEEDDSRARKHYDYDTIEEKTAGKETVSSATEKVDKSADVVQRAEPSTEDQPETPTTAVPATPNAAKMNFSAVKEEEDDNESPADSEVEEAESQPEYGVDSTSFNTDRLRAEIALLKKEADNSPNFTPETTHKADYSQVNDLPSWTTAPSLSLPEEEEHTNWATSSPFTNGHSTPALVFGTADGLVTDDSPEWAASPTPKHQTAAQNPWG